MCGQCICCCITFMLFSLSKLAWGAHLLRAVSALLLMLVKCCSFRASILCGAAWACASPLCALRTLLLASIKSKSTACPQVGDHGCLEPRPVAPHAAGRQRQAEQVPGAGGGRLAEPRAVPLKACNSACTAAVLLCLRRTAPTRLISSSDRIRGPGCSTAWPSTPRSATSTTPRQRVRCTRLGHAALALCGGASSQHLFRALPC